VSPGAFLTPTDVSSTALGLTIVDVKTAQAHAIAAPIRIIQPAWSPSGARIAFWTVKSNRGQRDIRTIAADGSDAATMGVAVTDDPAVDWNPIWSPDGKYLYFASTRGGTMSLWRVPIDERSGHVLGEPEPIYTPSTWSGYMSFSGDGSRLVFSALDYRSAVLRSPFDPVREAITGPPVQILKSNQPIRDHELSPDGKWLAFTTLGVQEDLFVASVDGTDYRRLTDDMYRDRGVSWSPDGSRIAFYSDRSGSYELWSIRSDGSALHPMTTNTGNPGFPVWSPRGDRLAFGYSSWHLIDPSKTSSPAPPGEPSPGVPEGKRFMPGSWSAGDRIAGIVSADNAITLDVAVYDLATHRVKLVPGDLARSPRWIFPAWLADARHLLVRRSEGIAIVDADSGAGRLLIPIGGLNVGHSLGVSRDNRWISYTETAAEGDIWLATFRNGAPTR